MIMSKGIGPPHPGPSPNAEREQKRREGNTLRNPVLCPALSEQRTGVSAGCGRFARIFRIDSDVKERRPSHDANGKPGA